VRREYERGRKSRYVESGPWTSKRRKVSSEMRENRYDQPSLYYYPSMKLPSNFPIPIMNGCMVRGTEDSRSMHSDGSSKRR